MLWGSDMGSRAVVKDCFTWRRLAQRLENWSRQDPNVDEKRKAFYRQSDPIFTFLLWVTGEKAERLTTAFSQIDSEVGRCGCVSPDLIELLEEPLLEEERVCLRNFSTFLVALNSYVGS